MSNPIAEFARLDGLLGALIPILNVEVQAEIIEAARQAGSVERMPEPYRSWLSATSTDDLPPEVLEINYAEVVAARENAEVPPAVAEGTL